MNADSSDDNIKQESKTLLRYFILKMVRFFCRMLYD